MNNPTLKKENTIVKKKIGCWGILGPPSFGICATIRIGREMLSLPYAGFLIHYRKHTYDYVSTCYY